MGVARLLVMGGVLRFYRQQTQPKLCLAAITTKCDMSPSSIPSPKKYSRSSICQIFTFHAEYFVTSKAERRRAWAISEIGCPLVPDNDDDNGDYPSKEEESLEHSSVETASTTSTTKQEGDAKMRENGKVENIGGLNLGGGGDAKGQTSEATSCEELVQDEEGSGRIDRTHIP